MAGKDHPRTGEQPKDFLCTVCGKPGVYLTDEGLMCRSHALSNKESEKKSEDRAE
jgi:hypothetical protein